MKGHALGALLLSSLLLIKTGTIAANPLPPLAQLKAAAESGDSVAQSKLGDVFFSSCDYAHAADWYAKAAMQGDAHAQFRIGHLFEFAPKSFSAEARNLPHLPQDNEQAVKWYQMAAAQDDADAQERLAMFYLDGKVLKRDKIEAYRWLTAASRVHWVSAKVTRDKLLLSMTLQEIQEGEKRASTFRPRKIVPTRQPDPPLATRLKLTGISSFGTNRSASINGVTFEPGRETYVPVGAQYRRMKCLEIRTNSVLLEVEGEGEKVELKQAK